MSRFFNIFAGNKFRNNDFEKKFKLLIELFNMGKTESTILSNIGNNLGNGKVRTNKIIIQKIKLTQKKEGLVIAEISINDPHIWFAEVRKEYIKFHIMKEGIDYTYVVTPGKIIARNEFIYELSEYNTILEF